MSPKPKRRLTKEPASKFSRSSKCSPVPKNTIGDSVAATAEREPPPFACPSSLVTITEPTLTDSLNAFAYAQQAQPMLPSITNKAWSGLMAAWTCFISSNKAVSYLWRPDVSTMIISYFCFLKKATPSSAIFTGSVSFRLPKKGHLILAEFYFSCSNAPALKVSAHTKPTRHPFFMQ